MNQKIQNITSTNKTTSKKLAFLIFPAKELTPPLGNVTTYGEREREREKPLIDG